MDYEKIKQINDNIKLLLKITIIKKKKKELKIIKKRKKKKYLY